VCKDGADPEDAEGRTTTTVQERPLLQIAFTWIFCIAALAELTGSGVMMLVMTATPLAMQKHGYSLSLSATTIQLHILGMFVPGFVTGSVIDALGKLNVILGGLLVLSVCLVVGLLGTELFNFMAGLILLGIGWNFCYIGGTRLLVEAHTEAESGKVQGLNEFVIQVANASAALLAGPMLNQFGWYGVCWTGVPLLSVTLVLALYWKVKRKLDERNVPAN